MIDHQFAAQLIALLQAAVGGAAVWVVFRVMGGFDRPDA
jgi:hypothetical protein